MKITDIKTYVLNTTSVFVRIYTDEGIEGVGECSPVVQSDVTAVYVQKALKPLLIGKDPRDTNRLWDDMYFGTFKIGGMGAGPNAISGVDIALWDIKAKAANMPLYQLMGGATKKTFKMYKSIGGGSRDTAEEMRQKVEDGYNQGFRAFKIRMDWQYHQDKRLKGDLEMFRVCREWLPDDVPLSFDVNNGYSVSAAISQGKEFEKLGIYHYEEPVLPYNYKGLREVAGAGEAVRFFERYSTRSIFGGQGGLQNFHVRLNVAYLLGELVVRKGDPSKGIPDSRYTDAANPLCDVVNETRQLDAIKVVAVRNLVRLMRTGEPDAGFDLRLRVAESFAKELKRPFQQSLVRQRANSHLQHIWYQEVLVEGLAGVGILVNKQAEPFVETVLAGVMADSNRHFLVRTAAAKALGRAPLGGAFDDGLRSYQLVELAGQMSAAYNKSPGAGYWPRSFQRLYFAFKAINKSELTVAGKPAGLLGQVATARLQDAYRQIVPLVAHVIVQPTAAADGKLYFQAISSETLKPLTDWLAENRPANYKPAQPTTTVPTAPTTAPAAKSSKGT